MHRFVFVVAFLAFMAATGFASPAHAELISNGDFETGDLTDWGTYGFEQVNGAKAATSVGFVNGSYRATLVASAETASGKSWSRGHIEIASKVFAVDVPSRLRFDASYFYTNVGDSSHIQIFAGAYGETPNTVGFSSARPIVIDWTGGSTNGAVGTTTYFAILEPQQEYLVYAAVGAFNEGTGSANVTLIVDNFRILPIPEPSTISLSISGLACLAWAYRKRLRRD